MNRDPIEALESYFSNQPTAHGGHFGDRVQKALSDECQDWDLAPVAAGLRKALPAAAAIVFSTLSSNVSRAEVQETVKSMEQARLGGSSSVSTELETPWQDSI